jgi:hypothetical protein
MCTSIIENARAEGMAKRGDEWFALSQAVVAYDHARHAPLGDVITLDFINTNLDPGARAGIELTLESAKELRAALDRAITAAEFEEAEVRGKGLGWAAGQDNPDPALPATSTRRIAGANVRDERPPRREAPREPKSEAVEGSARSRGWA